jgi:hypothetical protein
MGYRMKDYLYLTIAWLLMVCGLRTIQLTIQTMAVSSQRMSIVRLVKNQHTFCSGTVLNAHTVLTAYHCVEAAGDEPIEIRAFDDAPIHLFVSSRASMPSIDVAVLEGDVSAFPSQDYETDVTRLINIQQSGNKTKLCGYGNGGPLVCDSGLFVERYGFGTTTTAIGIPGMSGGPVFDAHGTLIGIVDAVESQGPHSVIVPIYNLKGVLL